LRQFGVIVDHIPIDTFTGRDVFPITLSGAAPAGTVPPADATMDAARSTWLNIADEIADAARSGPWTMSGIRVSPSHAKKLGTVRTRRHHGKIDSSSSPGADPTHRDRRPGGPR